MVCQKVCAGSQFSVVLTVAGKVSKVKVMSHAHHRDARCTYALHVSCE